MLLCYNNKVRFIERGIDMDKYKKLLSNTLILSIGTFASKLLVYFLMPLYTAILSKEQYGTADLITNAANLLIPFCCIGITHGVFRFAADKEENNKVIFSSGVSVLLISSAIFLILSIIHSHPQPSCCFRFGIRCTAFYLSAAPRHVLWSPPCENPNICRRSMLLSNRSDTAWCLSPNKDRCNPPIL